MFIDSSDDGKQVEFERTEGLQVPLGRDREVESKHGEHLSAPRPVDCSLIFTGHPIFRHGDWLVARNKDSDGDATEDIVQGMYLFDP